MINRREFGQRALTLIAGVPLLKIAPLAAQVNSRINGVRTGLQSACFTFSGIGPGDTPLKEVLLLVRDQKYDFPVCIEYVGPDGPAIEVARCFDFCKAILRSSGSGSDRGARPRAAD